MITIANSLDADQDQMNVVFELDPNILALLYCSWKNISKKLSRAAYQKTSDIIVMLKWHHHVVSHLSLLRNFWKPFFKYINAVFNGEQDKESIICVRMG